VLLATFCQRDRAITPTPPYLSFLSNPMKPQFFSHRPPSNTTLLSDPWPPALQVRKHRKTFHWPAYRNSQKGMIIVRTEITAGLQS